MVESLKGLGIVVLLESEPCSRKDRRSVHLDLCLSSMLWVEKPPLAFVVWPTSLLHPPSFKLACVLRVTEEERNPV